MIGIVKQIGGFRIGMEGPRIKILHYDLLKKSGDRKLCTSQNIVPLEVTR